MPITYSRSSIVGPHKSKFPIKNRSRFLLTFTIKGQEALNGQEIEEIR